MKPPRNGPARSFRNRGDHGLARACCQASTGPSRLNTLDRRHGPLFSPSQASGCLSPPWTMSCICCSTEVTVLDHLHAGILRSYSSSISGRAAGKGQHALQGWHSPLGLRDVQPHEDTHGDGQGAVHKAGPDPKCKEHRRSGVAVSCERWYLSSGTRERRRTYQVAMPVIELVKKVTGPVLTGVGWTRTCF
jgi:hypothetical protein